MERKTYRFLVGRNEERSILGRSRRKWKGLREVGWKGEDRTDVIQVRDTWWAFVNRVRNIFTTREYAGVPSRTLLFVVR
jgi:hypothetical protein